MSALALCGCNGVEMVWKGTTERQFGDIGRSNIRMRQLRKRSISTSMRRSYSAGPFPVVAFPVGNPDKLESVLYSFSAGWRLCRRDPLGGRTMGLFTKDIKSMQDLFLHTLQDVYYAENQIVKSLPTMIEKSTNRELAKGLREHLRETEGQVARLDKVFEKLGEEPKGTDCPAIDGLINEANEVASEVEDKEVLDAAIIGSAQAIEHYEISRYGTLIAWAQTLGHDNVTSLFNANLREERAADRKLNGLAEGRVNRKALGGRDAAARAGAARKKSRSGVKRRAAS
jgi:ferritin-like metal-binding protein YciE